MKRILLSLLLGSLLLADKIAIPMPASSLSVENSGTLIAIDAYQDGIGIYTVEQIGSAVIDNSDMNALVYKYGAEAKLAGVEVKEYINTYGNASEKVKALSIGKFEPMAKVIIPDGVLCSDGNARTINDKYIDGICVGVNIEGIYFLSPTGSNTNACTYESPCEDISIAPAGSTVVLKDGTYSGYYIKQAGWRTAPKVLRTSLVDMGGMRVIGETKDGVLIDYQIGSSSERDRSILYNMSNINIMNLKFNYKSNASTSYSSAFVSWINNVKFDNIDINVVSGVYAFNYVNTCTTAARPYYNNVKVTGGTRLDNYSCSHYINSTSIYTAGSFLNYL